MSDDRSNEQKESGSAEQANRQEQTWSSEGPQAQTSPGAASPPPGRPTRYARGSQQIQTVVEIATEFLKSTYPVGKDGNGDDDITVSRIIPNCLGGTLCLIEYQWDFDKSYYDCCIVVRQDGSEIYDSVPDVMRMIAAERVPWLYKISEPRVVIAFLTLFILFAGVSLYVWGGLNPKEVPEPFRSGLTAVLGYWLGQAFPVVRQGARTGTPG